jgi:hypothetical protein
MVKIIFVCLLFVASMSSNGQSLDDINQMMGKQQNAEAKTAIDRFLTDAKNSAKSDAWYYKGRIYNSLSYDKGTAPADAFNLKLQAFEAFKKNQQLDAKDLRMKVEAYKSYLDLYYGLYDLGANFYNAKEFDNAFQSFGKALEIKDFILDKKYAYPEAKLYALDTSLVMNTAIAAMQSKNSDGAALFYKKLTDANVEGDTYKEVYEFLADYYSNKDDSTNLHAILEKGKKLYPATEYWTSLEIDKLRSKGDKEVLFAKYEELIAQNPTSYVLPYNYSIEIFNSIYGKDAKSADEKAAKAKLSELLKAAMKNDKGMDATILMTKHTYNMSSDLSIAANLVKGAKPEDVKRKADLLAQTKKQMDEFLEYAKLASTYYDSLASLKPVQRATYQELLSNMSEIYNYKKDVKSAAETDKKRAAL